MKTKLIESFLLALGVICFICLCSEPAESTEATEGLTAAQYAIWEASWLAALGLDILLCHLVSRRSHE